MEKLSQVHNINRLYIFIITIFFVFNISVPLTSAKNYIDVSNYHTYANEALEQLIEVYAYDDYYDQRETQLMIDRMGEIPELIIEVALLKDVRLIFIDFPITDLEEFAYLQGEHPRGHDPFVVWDDIPGAGGQVTAARIGYSEQGRGHGSINLEYHEFGHAIEYALFDGEIIMNNDDFYDIYLAEKDYMFPGIDYMDYPEEYFAETLAYYYSGGSIAKELLDKAPQTYDFIKNLPTFVLYIVDESNEGITLKWGFNDTVNYYEIYRDGILLEVTDDHTYTDLTFESDSFHSYQVFGFNQADEIVQQTIFADVFTDENVSITISPEDHFVVEEIAAHEIILSWDKIKNAQYYELYRDDTLIAELTDTSFVDGDINPNTTYTYHVRAYNINETAVQYPTLKVDSLRTASLFGLSAQSLLISFGIIFVVSIGIVIFLHRK